MIVIIKTLHILKQQSWAHAHFIVRPLISYNFVGHSAIR